MDENLAPSNMTTHVLRGLTELLDFLPWDVVNPAYFVAGLGLTAAATAGAVIFFVVQRKAI